MQIYATNKTSTFCAREISIKNHNGITILRSKSAVFYQSQD